MATSKYTYRVGMDSSEAVQSLKSLKSSISSLTSEWKANQAEARMAGDRTKAATEKYEGLSKVIDKQKSYINGLRDTQQKLRDAQSKVDTSTKEGKNAYESYSEQIAKTSKNLASATSRLSSLSSQQSKAKNSMEYYKSGLAAAQHELKTMSASTNAYVDRLRAEGKQDEANKAQLSGLRSQYSKLSEIYRTQSSELEKIASTTGKSSEAYKRQEIRVNQTATSMAKAKSSMNELDSSMRKANPSIFDRIKNKLQGVNKEGQQTHRTFKEVFTGSALGQAAANALSNVGSQLQGVYKNGMQANETIEKINYRFGKMGQSRAGVKRLDDQIKELKYNTAMSGDQVADLQTKMMSWSKIGNRGAMQMAKMIAGVGDSSKISGEETARLGASLMRVGSTGKVTASSLSRIAKQAPTFYTQLAKGAGMSVGRMKQLLSTGKVTQAQFQRWMANAAKYSNSSFKVFDQSQEGSVHRMQQSWTDLQRTMTKPLFNAKTAGLQALSKLMTSPELMRGAKAIGNGVSQAIGVIYKHRKDVSGILKDFISLGVSVGKAVWKDFSAIFVDIAKSFGLIHGNAKKSGSSLHSVRVAMDGLAKNKTAISLISKAIIAMAAVKTLSPISNGLLGIAGGGYKAYRNIKALHAGLKGVRDVKEFKGAEGAFNKLGVSASSTAKKIAKAFGPKGALQSLRSASKNGGLSTAGIIANTAAGAGVAVSTARSIVKAIKDKAGSKKQYEDIGQSAGTAIGGGIGLYFGGPVGAAIGAKIGGTLGKWGGDAAKKFTKGWDAHKPPKNKFSIENFGWSAHNMFNQMGKWGAGVAKNFSKGINKGQSNIKKALNRSSKSMHSAAKGWNKWSNQVGKNTQKAFNKAGSATRKGWKFIENHTSKGTKQILKSVAGFGKRYVKSHQRYTKATLKNFGSFGKRLKKNHGNLFTTIGQTAKTQLKIEQRRWHDDWNNISKTSKGIWHGIQSNSHNFYNNLNNLTHGGLGKVFNGFKSFGKGLWSFWTKLFGNIEKFFNRVFGGINKTIHGVQSSIGKLMGGKLKVGSLHLANGTDWRRRYPIQAIVNDGHDSPRTNNREGLIDTDGSIHPYPNIPNLRTMLLPGQEVINARDLAWMMQIHHFARGTRSLGLSRVNGTSGSSLSSLSVQLKRLITILKQVRKLAVINVKLKGAKAVKQLASNLKKSDKASRNLAKGLKKASDASNRLARLSRSVGRAVKSSYQSVKRYNFAKLIQKEVSKSTKTAIKDMNRFVKDFDNDQRKMVKNSNENTKKLVKNFSSEWKKVLKDATSDYKKWIDQNEKMQKEFNSKFQKGWKSLDNAVDSIYKKFWSNMHSTARKGMNAVLSVLNGGISRIDSVVHQFGGSGRAIHRVSKLASGTGALGGVRRAITSPTLALLNDGNDSPETGNKETIWDRVNNAFHVVQGRNVPYVLKPGQEVLNATESRMLGFTHFAGGTGALHHLYELAKKYWGKPLQTGNGMFNAIHGLTGAINSLAHGMQKTGQGQGVNWWSQLWNMVENKVEDSDGPASGLLKAVEELGRGTKYSQARRMSNGYFDCSSLVSRALKKFYHKAWAVPNGWALTVSGLWRHAHRISRSEAKPGDPIFWLPNSHVGVYAGGDRYWSAFGPGAHPDVGMHSIKGSVPGTSPTFARFNGLSTTGNDKNPKVKASNRLQKLIRSQVGKGFWRTIDKIAAKYGASAIGGTLHGPEKERAKELVRMLMHADPHATKKGAIALAGNAMLESGFNSGITNSIGASGLWQWLGGRATGLRAYAHRHGHSWKGAGVQVSYALHGDDAADRATFRRILEGHGSIASLANAFSKEWERGGYNAQHTADAIQIGHMFGYANGGLATAPSIFGEDGPEMAIPLSAVKSSRAYELLGKTISILTARDGSQASISQLQKDQKEDQERWAMLFNFLTDLVGEMADTTIKTDVKIDGRTTWQAISKYARQEFKRMAISQRKGYAHGI